MDMKRDVKIPIFLFIFSLVVGAGILASPALKKAQALDISVSPAKFVNGEYYIVKGTVIQINLSGKSNEDVDTSITCKFRVPGHEGRYEYELKDFPIPIDVNSVVIRSYYVESLKIEVPVVPFFSYSKETNANASGIATITINRHIGKGQYTIKISGNTSNSAVTIEATANSVITLDQDGRYSITYDTSKLPVGNLIVNAGGIVFRANVVESESEIPTTPTTTEVTAGMLAIQQVDVTITEVDGVYYANVQLTLPNSCYRVLWDSAELHGNEFFGDARVFKLSGQCLQVLTEFKHSYELGHLKPGKYGFTFRIAGEKIRFVEFLVPKSETKLSMIEVSIEPKSTKAKPGDRITYTVTLNWDPKEWEGLVNVSLVISAAGFEKRYEVLQITMKGSTPPLSRQISFEIPKNLPPTTYNVKLIVSADSVNASDEASLNVSLPGFEAVFGVAAVIIALMIRRLTR